MSEMETPFTATYLSVGTLMYVLAAYKTLAWTRERIPGLLLMAGAAFAVGTGFISAAPDLYRWIGRTSGLSNLATLVVYSSVIICCAFFLVLVLLWSPTSTAGNGSSEAAPPARVRAALRRVMPPYAAVVVLMAVLFFSADLPDGEVPLTFDTTFADRPIVFAYLLVYLAGFTVALWSMGYVSWRRSKDYKDPVVHANLLRLEVGCFVCSGYSLFKIIAVSGRALGTSALDALSTAVGPASSSLGCLIIASGWVAGAVRLRRQRRRDFRALETLWRTVTRADPGVVLTSPPAGSSWDFHALGRVGEIRDGQLALRPWTSQDVVDTAKRLGEAEGLAAPEQDAVAAAAALHGALLALESGQTPRRPCERPPGIDVPPHVERQHLVTVARHLDGPLVRRVLAEVTST